MWKLSVLFVHSGMVPPILLRNPEISFKGFFASLPPSTLLRSVLFRTINSDSSASRELFFLSCPLFERSSFFLKGENISTKYWWKSEKLVKGIKILQFRKGTVEILRERSRIRHFRWFLSLERRLVKCFDFKGITGVQKCPNNYLYKFFHKHLTRPPV